MIGRTPLMILALLSQLQLTAVARENGANWLASERSHLSEKWSDHKHKKEIKKAAFHDCRVRATHERIAATSRAEFVHRCVREQLNAEVGGQLLPAY
jgi:hypothetical protein